MKLKKLYFIFLASFLVAACSENISAENTEPLAWQSDYTKQEITIEMRDGIQLFTTIYSPKDTTQSYPVLMQRTPYSCKPYGIDTMPAKLIHNPDLVASGYIFIKQDVRGRWISEGDYENTKPPYSLFDSSATDELTDTWDTFEWLADSLKNYNGNAGLYGTSYPGWTTLVGARSNHPAIKAVIASAPVTNFYFEDFNRYGLFGLNYLPVIHAFGTPRPGPTDTAWYKSNDEAYGIIDSSKVYPDYYDFFLDRFTLNNYWDVLDSSDFFWQNIRAHANYDEFRKMRDWEQYYNDIECQVMVLGGWNDEQNLYGILNSFKHIEENSPKSNAQFVMGPWSHGHPTRADSAYYLGNVFYGYNLSTDFMENVEFPYFEKHLKGKGEAPDFSVKLFDTGKNEWAYFDEYPDSTGEELTYFLYQDKMNAAYPEITQENDYQTYISDPFHPVPGLEGDDWYNMAPKPYFTADQRYTQKRPDVLTFETDVLNEDITVLGEIKALIDFATNLSAADIYVKVIDVYPMDRLPEDTDIEGVKMNGYQRLVRAGYIRGRYRNGFEQGEPFVANQKTTVEVPLLDVFHTFKSGHRIMIQIQSSMFPIFDLNPQNYVEDIYNAEKDDFAVAMHKVFATSRIVLPIE
ncbi:MAG: putative CocE/NonD family hydrolase [Crocinitomix sp.]|jgi:putative CocE/NonD family hydrolase